MVEKKRKKKGRPSLLDIQKRALRLQKQLQQREDPDSSPRSRNPNDDGDRKRGREEKKLKFVHCLTSDGAPGSFADLESKLGVGNQTDGQTSFSKATEASQGDASDSGPTTPLPDKKLLVFILDMLQKKDTHDVFSEPVDPNELPDYHEIIEHPMDFGTIRKKLADGAYANLEQFEKDVFLICSNAMHYNAPETIFFRQARNIQELAKKNFENLRQESDDSEPETLVVCKEQPPGKNIKKLAGRSPIASTKSNFSSCATLTPADIVHYAKISNGMPRKSSEESNIMQLSAPTHPMFRNGDNRCHSTGTLLKGMSTRYPKKVNAFDENRRNTYSQTQTSTYLCEPSILTIFDGEKKQMMPVGLHMEHSYTRSLSRFAANFGPAGWEIAARVIRKALPSGTMFGHGWVGEKDRPQLHQSPSQSTSSTVPATQPVSSQHFCMSKADIKPERPEPHSNTPVADQSRIFPSTSATAGLSIHSDVTDDAKASKDFSYDRNSSPAYGDGASQQASFQFYQSSPIHPITENVLKSGLEFNLSQLGNMSRPVMLAGSLHSQVPMTHAQVLNMVSRRDNRMFQSGSEDKS